ncbi:MAG: FKBP-type peptidyl-prolyl cis-trans isomerase [Oscillospiraceae bacterium]|nr:FKBP-type peptidyl-prolyl cis-trans isomerase [Oscillospiraceae bacterium]
MRKFKTLICLFLALAIPVIMLAGCVASNNESDEPTEEIVDTSGNTTQSEPPSTSYDPYTFRDAIDDNGFFKGVKALDHVEMFDYKSMTFPSEAYQVTEEDLKSQVDYIVSQFAEPNQIMDREVADGDTVNIDYVGSVDGVEFEGGSTDGMGTDVTIGVTEYIDDFLEQLIGHMPGETFDVNVTFPDSYPMNPDLENAEAVFVTTINYISDISETLTDEFVNLNLSEYYGWTTVAEMEEGLRADMRKYSMQQYLKDYFTYQVNILSMPDQIINYQENSMLNYYYEYADYYGVEFEELLSGEGFTTVDELIDAYYETNLTNAQSMLVLLAIAEDAGMTVSDTDVEDYFQTNNMAEDIDSIVEQYGMPFIKYNVLCQKVIDFIIDNAILA